ncbi:MAG: protein kinase [Pirellulales bacterium]|nr:protein kinase [Pirellulales bacterium]
MRPNSLSEHEQRLGEVIAAYLEAIDRGDQARQEDWLARYPEFAAELEEFFAGVEQVDQLAAPLRSSADGHDSTATWAVYSVGPRADAASATSTRSLGDYELLEEIGRGGMGIVYKARQRSLNRLVALKMLRPGLLASPADLQRFRNEAAILATLDHPNILPIYEIGECHGQPYFTIKLVEGGSLAEHLAEFRGDPRNSARLLLVLADAVHHAHRHGVLHRDLKPSNVLLDSQQRAYITDFGLARQLDRDETLSCSRDMLGTPSYMAPEQILGRKKATSAAADVYGLGAILYSLLTGRAPFREPTVFGTLEQVLVQDPEPPSSANRRVDRDLQTICLKCLEKDPRNRYACAGELMDDLARWLDGKLIRARSVGRLARFWRWCKRFPAVAGLTATTAVLLVAIAVSLALSNLRISQAQRETETERQKAVLEAREAARQRDYARDQQQIAEQQRSIADLSASAARRSLYAADMNLAQYAWESGHAARALELLESHRPRPGGQDLRGFEWYYLWRLCHSDRATLLGHEGWVSSVAIAPDGKTLATASFDHTVRLWDLAARRTLAVLRGHTGSIICVAFGPDGRTLASGSVDRTVRLWDVATRKQRATLAGHSQVVWSLTFHPDRALLATGSHDGSIKLWNAATAREESTLAGHTAGVWSVAFSPDGRWLASAGYDCQVRLWDVAAAKEQGPLGSHSSWVYAVGFSPDGKRLASGDVQGNVKLWDVSQRRELGGFQAHAYGLLATVFSPDGATLATAGADQTIRLWDPAARRELATFPEHSSISSLAWAADGEMLAAAAADNTVRLWNVKTGKPWSGPEVHVSELPPTGQVLDRRTLPMANVMSVAFSPDGRILASGGGALGQDAVLQLFDARTGDKRTSLQGHTNSVLSAAFAPDGRWLATASMDGTVRLWEMRGGKPVAALHGHSGHCCAVAFSPDGRTLASGGFDAIVRLWDPATRRPCGQLAGHTAPVWSIAFAPDGATLATGSFDGSIKLWDLAARRARATLQGHAGNVYALAFAPGGKTLASGSMDGAAKLWDAQTGEEQLTIHGHTAGISSIAYSPDGRTLATGSLDHTARLWDPVTGQQRATLRGHTQIVYSVAFSPDGRTLATGGSDCVNLWEADVGEVLAGAKED